MTQEDFLEVLDNLYCKALDGIPIVSPPIDVLANNYLQKNTSVEKAVKEFINYQTIKCTTSGFLTGLGGIITLPVAVPANIGSVMYVQVRMIACIAYMGGYDVNSDQVQTLVYACLGGISLEQVIKEMGIQFETKFSKSMLKKLPGSVLTKINQKVGFRFVTKSGEKGVVSLGKGIPFVGGIVGEGIDLAETKIIANRAYKMFIKGDFS